MGRKYDLYNQKSGTLIAKKYLGESKWFCICEVCNNEVIITTDLFHKNQRVGRDGCKHAKSVKIGDTFGFLTVIAPSEDYIKPKSGAHEKRWLCKCTCGREKSVLESNLKSYKSIKCGKCSNRVSIPEKMIVYYLSQYFDDIIEQYEPDFLDGKEIDIFVPRLNLGIEYDGVRWHKNPKLDKLKDEICKKNNVQLIRIREPLCPKLESSICIYTPKATTNGTHMTNPIKSLINYINANYNCNINLEVDRLKDNANVCKTLIKKQEFGSLINNYPNIAKEWDYEKNKPLKPSDIAAHSGRKVWWICSKCGLSYSSVVASRTGVDKCGCPACRYKKAYKKVLCVELNKEFESVKCAAKFVNKKPCSITSSVKLNTTCGGYHWKKV